MLEDDDADLPLVVEQFGENPRNILQQQILGRNPSIRSRTDSEQTSQEEETEEEKLRREDKKARNRAAARKCREKKEKRATELEEEVARLERQRDEIMAEVAELQQEWDTLQELTNHQCPLNNNNYGEIPLDVQAEEPLDTPTDENEMQLLSNYHFDEQATGEDTPTQAMDVSGENVEAPPEMEGEVMIFENVGVGELNTPDVEARELYFL